MRLGGTVCCRRRMFIGSRSELQCGAERGSAVGVVVHEG